MSFKVDPSEIRSYAAQLQETYLDVADAKTYVHANGDFSIHQTGLIGLLSGRHAAWVERLDQMLGQLLVLTEASPRALREIANTYDNTDEQAAARVDASYPAAPRTPANLD